MLNAFIEVEIDIVLQIYWFSVLDKLNVNYILFQSKV